MGEFMYCSARILMGVVREETIYLIFSKKETLANIAEIGHL